MLCFPSPIDNLLLDSHQILLFLISLIANLFSALAGGGAGLIQLPALIFLGLPFGIALATHKVASIALGVGATLRHLKSAPLDRSFALFILACGIPGVVLGANIIFQIPENIAQFSLGLLTISLGIYSFLSPQLGQDCAHKNRHTKGHVMGGSIIFLMGILNGSLTSGTGLFVTIWLIRWFGLDYKTAVTYTLILVGMFWNASGALTLGILGDIYWQWLPALLAGSLIGGYLGAHLAIVKGNKVIKRTYEIITLLVGLKLVL